jgi:glycosyltransferase involved in cell wall biosynthesis
MPVYNGERFVDQALSSIRGQTFVDFRLVVSDNASTDATREIVREHARVDDRVLLLESRENRGAAWNYNNALGHCSSPFFKWAAADDELAPTCLERSMQALAEHPEAVLAYPHTRMIGEDGSVLGDMADGLAIASSSSLRRLWHVVRVMVWGNTIFSLVRTDALRMTRLHGNYASADYVLLAELSLLGQFVEIPEPLFLRRVHGGMSRQANLTAGEVAAWFDPTSTPVASELRNLYVQYVAGVRHADLSRTHRAAATVVLSAAFLRRHNGIRRRLALVTQTGRARRPGP